MLDHAPSEHHLWQLQEGLTSLPLHSSIPVYHQHVILGAALLANGHWQIAVFLFPKKEALPSLSF